MNAMSKTGKYIYGVIPNVTTHRSCAFPNEATQRDYSSGSRSDSEAETTFGTESQRDTETSATFGINSNVDFQLFIPEDFLPGIAERSGEGREQKRELKILKKHFEEAIELIKKRNNKK